ncbi:glycosyltransferase involved in cell wall biosynthesis [Pontibacter ummariensis]|uniref:Glycosyltransferase involved in cell wall bisynthesis n=1 Tax=Pontibacter ummariensis TaxID=1610492 RepID=A0A239BM65_9BACT|nr:glycosyltransferase [Pontibacter ummariensis]PRY15767.1 glycosyltransferase involved in cell wall biosynthesis [Pontibacter ummariensis]SNS08709.1 Glycosyltransferase involved in cell wall bisynthesis [Pontibacter ummariensis]
MMEVLHITTFDSGGAGGAASRLHSSLLKLGVSSKLLCLKQTNNRVEDVYKFPSQERIYPSIFKRLLRKLNIGYSYNERLLLNLSKVKESYELFTSPLSDHQIHLHRLVQQADVIHLHWVANFVDYPSFFKNINKPIIWTLHDFNPDQGGFHLQSDTLGIECQILKRYEDEFIKIKRDAIFNSDVTFVSPSNWFHKRLKHNVISKVKKEVIYHGVDEQVYHSYDKLFSRRVLNLDYDEKVFICIASNLNRKAKGFDLLISSLDNLAKDCKFRLLAVGTESNITRPYITYLGNIDNESFLTLTYSAADAFLSFSNEESFGLCAAEALLCGLPVVSTPVGIMEDVVIDGFNGFLSQSFEVDEFYCTLKRFLLSEQCFSNTKIRESAIVHFSLMNQTRKYLNLYKSVLKSAI